MPETLEDIAAEYLEQRLALEHERMRLIASALQEDLNAAARDVVRRLIVDPVVARILSRMSLLRRQAIANARRKNWRHVH